jgi:hypothetical protein
MAELILEYSTQIRTADGERFVVRAMGEERPDRTWIGWLEFVSINGNGATLTTDRETTQPNRVTLDYWASGLEPVYLEGAFARAQARCTTSPHA